MYGTMFLVRSVYQIEPIWTNLDLKAKNALYTHLAFNKLSFILIHS